MDQIFGVVRAQDTRTFFIQLIRRYNMSTNDTSSTIITRQLVPEDQRMDVTAALFSIHFPMLLEPAIYNITERLSKDYRGGYWDFYELSNGGFYMAPHADKPFNVSCENGFEDQLSADALGITACLYAYSTLSFNGDAFAELCAEQYHLLREVLNGHGEVGSILAAID
jgi:hypothetical protein